MLCVHVMDEQTQLMKYYSARDDFHFQCVNIFLKSMSKCHRTLGINGEKASIPPSAAILMLFMQNVGDKMAPLR